MLSSSSTIGRDGSPDMEYGDGVGGKADEKDDLWVSAGVVEPWGVGVGVDGEGGSEGLGGM